MNRIKYSLPNSFYWIISFTFFSINACAQVAPKPAAIAAGKKINYVRTFTSTIPEKNPNTLVGKATLLGGGVEQVTTYIDGLGRTVEQINTLASQPGDGITGLAPKDIVSLKRFDFDGSLGSQVKNLDYLPFVFQGSSSNYTNGFISAPFDVQEIFWQTKHPDEQYFYRETRTERSPLNRIEKALGVGDALVGGNNGVSNQYELNTQTENVRIWNIVSGTGFLPPASSQAYSTGKLTKSITIDEKGKKVYTYTDFDGKIILKKVQEKEAGLNLDENGHDGWLSTYYVYDDLDQLRTIITPKAVKYLQLNNWVFNSNDVYQELCFWYQYDEKGRIIIRHSPSAGTIQMVYDNKDRIVLSQDENQRNRPAKQWSFYLYDDQNRMIATGLFDKDATRDAMATFVNSLNNGIVSINIYTGSSETLKADNPVSGSSVYCNSCSNTVINTVAYYDEYTYQGAKAFNTDFSFAPVETSGYSPNQNLYVEAIIKTPRTLGFTTGTKTRVIDNNYDDGNPANDQFLTSTVYYNDKGRTIQELTDNVKNAVDYTTTQYDFAGRTIGVCEKHTMPGTSLNNYTTISKFDFDWLKRVTGIYKKFGNENYKKLVAYTYDEFGKIKTKKLSPDYNNGAGIETLNYDYNIQGWLRGINKDYALSSSSLSQWDHYFGMYMGYDNRDSRFTAAQYNGNITGTIWKSQGDNMPRKYNYEYDNANRFAKALFTQKTSPSETNWVNNKMDFSVTDISYDENGNLKTMFQKGVIPGNNSPVFIDKLTYEYKTVAGNQWSNQLKKVFDQPDLTASNNGSLGDFKDETFGTNGDDYTYDYNGNLAKDNNKKIRVSSNSGIQYNYFDKPQKITIESKSVTEFTYDAYGLKLAKKITNTVTGVSKTTWYMGDFIYEETGGQTNLQMILHEEGRIRVSTPVSNPRLTIAGNFNLPDNKKGTFDFFVKDNLQNTRAILTEETHSEFNNCSMEDASGSYEERMFGQVDASGNPVGGSNEVSSTRVNRTDAPGWASNTTGKISKLGYFGKKVGPNMILKVMAGDNIAARTDYYYNDPIDNSAPNNILPNILNSLVSSLSYSQTTSNVHGAANNITSNINTTPGDFGTFLNNQNTGTNSTPQAYMNILFFDENFNFIPYDNVTGLGSYAWRVTNSGDGQSIPLQVSKAPKNGYAFVYLSNESKTNVYFDNFEVTHVRGRLIEENVYYPFGLRISGISGKVFDAADNAFGYQGDFNDFEGETNWNEFELRSFDGQIGRFLQNDPYDQFANPYTGMGNNPINNIDMDGGWSFGPMGSEFLNHVFWTAGGAAIGGIIGGANGGEDGMWRGMAIGGAMGLGFSYVNWGNVGNWFENFNFNIRAGITGNLYKSIEAASIAAAEQIAGNTNKNGVEYSSLIFEVTSDDGKTKLYGYTPIKSFVGVEGRDPTAQSPGPADPLHTKNVPNGATWVGHVHSHTGQAGWRDNNDFSPTTFKQRGDNGLMKDFPNLRFFLVTPEGNLINDTQGKDFPTVKGLPAPKKPADQPLEVKWDQLPSNIDLKPVIEKWRKDFFDGYQFKTRKKKKKN